MELVRRLHVLVENFTRNRHETRVSHPRAVMAVGRFALLVGAHLAEGDFVRLRIVLDRNLRRHAAHRERAALVARLDAQERVRTQEVRRHRHDSAIRQHEVRALRELLDEAEDVVPTAAVERDDVVLQLVQDLVHLERGENGLDQHGGLDRAVRHADVLLGEVEHLGPQACFEVAFHLRQIEIRDRYRARALPSRCGRSTAEVDERAGNLRAVLGDVLLVQMPATRTHDEHGALRN